MAIKTYRALIASGDQERISLRTNTGKMGYRIVKFELLEQTPMTVESESVVKIFSEKQSATIDGVINFSDQSLLAAGFIEGQAAAKETGGPSIVIFENMMFNQDIFITHSSQQSVAVNYYLELEQVKLSDNETTMATLQSIRSRYESYTPAGPT